MAEEIVESALKRKRRKRDMAIIYRHLLRAQSCGSYVRYYIKRDMPEKLDEIEGALNDIIRAWEYIRDMELKLSPVSPDSLRRLIILLGEKPSSALTRGIMELIYALRKLSVYEDLGFMLDTLRKSLWTYQAIERELREEGQ